MTGGSFDACESGNFGDNRRYLFKGVAEFCQSHRNQAVDESHRAAAAKLLVLDKRIFGFGGSRALFVNAEGGADCSGGGDASYKTVAERLRIANVRPKFAGLLYNGAPFVADSQIFRAYALFETVDCIGRRKRFFRGKVEIARSGNFQAGKLFEFVVHERVHIDNPLHAVFDKRELCKISEYPRKLGADRIASRC